MRLILYGDEVVACLADRRLSFAAIPIFCVKMLEKADILCYNTTDNRIIMCRYAHLLIVIAKPLASLS